MMKNASLFGFVKKLIRQINAIFRQPKFVKSCVSETWEGLADYAQENQLIFQTSTNYQKLALSAPICLVGKPVEAFKPFDSHTKSVVLTFKDKGAYFAHDHLLDAKNQVIYHPEMYLSQLPIRQKALPQKIRKLKGTIAYLSNTASDHYGHWLRLALPMLGLYEKEIDLREIAYFYVGDVLIKPFMRETFELLGIPTEKIINFPCTSETLMIACNRWEMQQGNRYLDIESYEFIRHRVGKAVENYMPSCKNCYPRLAYIARGEVKWRNVINEKEVVALMQKYGFEGRIMDKLPVLEQMRIFQQASCIIAPHGSALTNLFFAKPHTKVLEIFPENYFDHAGYTLASLSQCEYYYMSSKTPDNQARILPPYQDMYVDIKLLEEHIKFLL